MLEVREVDVFYGLIHAIQGVSVRVEQNEAVSIIGANGAGKTTLLRTICGLNRIKGGDIVFKGKSLKNLRTHEIVRLGITMVPEGRKVFPNLTVLENLLLGSYGLSGSKKTKELLDFVLLTFPRLRERLKQPAGTLSGGEQQMLAIGRALMADPELLLLDEPSMGLSPILTGEIFSLLDEIRSKKGISILLVEQNANLALELTHRTYLLEGGRVLLEGPSKELRNHPKVLEAYLGVCGNSK